MTSISGGTARTPEVVPVFAVLAFEPVPALVSETAPLVLLRGGWKYAVAKVLKLKAGASTSCYVITAHDRDEAIELFREKQIAPAAWLAWRAAKCFRNSQRPPTMRALIGLEWLSEGRRRAWFRKDTAGLFGGHVRVVGDPPPRGADPVQVEAYQARARTEKERLEAAWAKKSAMGGLFPNTDIIEYLGAL